MYRFRLDPQAKIVGRAFLALGRVSNLPTVWSNCLAGYLLGGAGDLWSFFCLCLGASCIYLGGVFLNDAFDAEFDRWTRPSRPVPSGVMDRHSVFIWGLVWLLTGWLLVTPLGAWTGWIALILILGVIVYDGVHKLVAFSPLLMGACRLLLVLLAASTSHGGVRGLASWSALALGAYVAGLSYLARRETSRQKPPKWPVTLLAIPIALSWLANQGTFLWRALLLSLVLAAWIGWALYLAWGGNHPNLPRSVSALLAGIVVVDWLSVAGGDAIISLVFILFFALALVLQRFVPAT